MKVIIGSGKVANIIKNPEDIVLSHNDIEIKDVKSIESQFSKLNLSNNSIVINTAAKINLEWCEENREEARLVNFEGALNIAEVSEKYGCHLVHVSSGCIFDGMETEKVYTESDEPTPAAWYAETKAMADKALINSTNKKITIIRPRQLISSTPHPTNMLTKFMSMGSGEFIDSKNSITCIEDMKLMLEHLINKNQYGIFNLANVGWISPYQIAQRIKHKVMPSLSVKKISYEDYLSGLKVKRVNTLLSISKLSSTGFIPQNAMAALDWCLENYGKNV